MFSLGDFHTIRGFEVVTGHDVVDVVDASGSHPDFGEIDGPDTSIGVLALILGKVGCVHVIMDVSEMSRVVPISFIPFLVVELFVVVMGRVDGEVFGHPGG